MLYDSNTDKVHILNETGIIIWELLDGKNTIPWIENELVEKFTDIPKETISKDLAEIIEKLKSEGLIIKEGAKKDI